MSEKRRKYSPEFKEEAVKLVTEASRAIAEVAREIGVNEGTLGSGSVRFFVVRHEALLFRVEVRGLRRWPVVAGW